MSNKTFVNLSREECLRECSVLFENAKRKWKTAETVAEIEKDYGSAVTLSIVSIEEFVKGLILYLDGKGFEFRSVKGVAGILNKNHEMRYFIAFVMFTINVIGNDVFKWMKRFMMNPEYAESLTKQLEEKDRVLDVKMKFYLLRRLVKLRTEYEWFERVNSYRQDGLYTDYQDGALKSPMVIDKNYYKDVRKRLKKIYLMCMQILVVPNERAQGIEDKAYNDVLQMFKKDNIYEKLSNAINTVKSSKMSPFELARQQFKS